MSAKDYEICPALFNAYIAKVRKNNPNQMTDDRRVITENEILSLIHWWIRNKANGEVGHTEVVTVGDKPIFEVKYLAKED